MTNPYAVGDKRYFTHSLPDGGVLTFSARVLKLGKAKGSGRPVTLVQIPARVTRIPFPPFDGKSQVWTYADLESGMALH